MIHMSLFHSSAVASSFFFLAAFLGATAYCSRWPSSSPSAQPFGFFNAVMA
jgi:hypothetical protein